MLLHGVTRRWQTFLPLVPTLAPRWELHGLDFRGHGASQPTDGGYLVVDFVQDVVGLLNELNGPAVIYGHSLGAMVTAAVAAEVPEKVRAIVMEDPPLNTMGPRFAETNFYSHFCGIQKFAGDQREVAAVAKELAELRVVDPASGNETKLGGLRDGPSLRFMASCLQKLDPGVLVPIVESRWLDGYDIDGIFSGLQCPALLVQADMAAGGMLSDDDSMHVEKLASDLTRVKLPGVGHTVHSTQTERLSNLLLGFLESL